MGTKTYTSAFERLASLPDAFTGRDLTAKFKWSAATASTYLANWRRAGLIHSLGGHSDAHVNLSASRYPNFEPALRRILPEAVKVGADVLREAGWTTQIPSMPEVAIMSTSPLYALSDFQLKRRSAKWFAVVRPGLDEHGAAWAGLRRLAPAWALADMLARALDGRVKGSWLLAPDDLDFEAIESDAGLAAACEAFGLGAGALSEGGYCAAYDHLAAVPRDSRRLEEAQR